MAVRYLFIKDRMDEGDIKIHHFPTEEMVGGFFTKPLQGADFIRFRDLIMGKVAHDFSTTLPRQAFDTSKPRSALDNKLQKGSGDVRINKNTGASVQTHVEKGWTVVSQKNTKTKNI